MIVWSPFRPDLMLVKNKNINFRIHLGFVKAFVVRSNSIRFLKEIFNPGVTMENYNSFTYLYLLFCLVILLLENKKNVSAK